MKLNIQRLIQTLLLIQILVSLVSCATTKAEDPIQLKKDSELRDLIKEKFNHEKYADLDHVDILVYQGDVVLSGLIFQERDRATAIDDAKTVKSVKSVEDQMELDVNGF